MPLAAIVMGSLALVLVLGNKKASTAAGAQLDANLPGDVAQAVGIALTAEKVPAHLQGFSSRLLPNYPRASAALAARAKTLGG